MLILGPFSEPIGEDSIQLLDNCHDVTSRPVQIAMAESVIAMSLGSPCTVPDKLSPSSLCGHAGFTATSTVFDALGRNVSQYVSGEA